MVLFYKFINFIQGKMAYSEFNIRINETTSIIMEWYQFSIAENSKKIMVVYDGHNNLIYEKIWLRWS